MKEIGKQLTVAVHWRVDVQSVDKYGNKTKNYALMLSVDLNEIRIINFENTPDQKVLDFTKIELLRSIVRRDIAVLG